MNPDRGVKLYPETEIYISGRVKWLSGSVITRIPSFEKMESFSETKLPNSNFIQFLHQPVGFGKGEDDFLVMKYIFEIQGAAVPVF